MASGPRTTIVLLAGGLATRLPNKLALPVEGEPMLVRIHRRLTSGGRPCVISARTELVPEIARQLRCPVAFDEYPDGGPLGGLASAAAQVRTPLFFAAAGDIPNVGEDFVARLESAYDAAQGSDGERPQAVLPTWPDGKVEPLAALYETEAFLRGAQAALAAGLRKVTSALAGLRVLPFDAHPEDEAALANVNTADEYRRLTAR